MTVTDQRKPSLLTILECFMALGIVLYVVTGQIFLLYFHQRYIYLYIAQFLFMGTLFYMGFSKRIIYVHSPEANLLLLSFFFSMSSAVRKMELNYVITAVSVFCQFLVLYFIVAYIEDRIHERRSEAPSYVPALLKHVIRALKGVTLIHVIYVILQYLMLKYFELHLNKIIFIDFLNVDTSTLIYRSLRLTGFTYSQSLLAPMFIIGLLLFSNPFIRLAIICAAFICRSSTAVGGVGLAVFLLFVRAVMEGRWRPSYLKAQFTAWPLWKKIAGPLLAAGAVAFIFLTKLDAKICKEVLYLFNRIFGESKGGQHFDYFRRLPETLPRMTNYQKLFGYGNNCSGYPMTLLGYTNFLGSAIVECDYVDTFLSRGIFGFLTTYGLLISMGIRGYRKDKRYLIVTLCFLLMAAGYNIQWHYALFFILLLCVCLREKIDFFRVADNVFTLKKKA